MNHVRFGEQDLDATVVRFQRSKSTSCTRRILDLITTRNERTFVSVHCEHNSTPKTMLVFTVGKLNDQLITGDVV